MPLDVVNPANAILGNPTPPIDPIKTLSGIAQYQNALAENKLIQQNTANALLANQTGQQELGQKMAGRHAQLMFGLAQLPDDQLIPAAQRTLDYEKSTGQVDEQRYGAMNARIQANANNPAALRAEMLQGLVGNLPGAQALAAVTPEVVNQEIGGQIVPRIMQSPIARFNGNFGVGVAPGTINRSLAPGYAETGGSLVPVGGGLGQPTLNKTLTPGEAVGLQQQLVQNPDGTYSVRTANVGQLYPGANPPALNVGKGNYPGPPATNIPVGTGQQIEQNTKQFVTDQQTVPALQTGTQSLNKALGALNAVATGAGTEGLARMRSYAVSLGNVLGIPTGGVNIQDMNRSELTKYLTDYARQSGMAGRSDAALESAFKSNASGEINNAAAQDVVRTNIGRDRQRIASIMTSNPQGHATHLTEFATVTDPRGFAWDTYTPAQQQQILKEVGPKGSEGYKKLATAIGYGRKLGLTQTGAYTGENANSAAPSGSQ